jgi:hypothetical protein
VNAGETEANDDDVLAVAHAGVFRATASSDGTALKG